MVNLRILVENVTAVIAAGYTVIRVYTDTAEDGTFTTLSGTETLVAGTESYTYTDNTGTSSTWYKTAYYGAGPGEGSKSSARRGETSSAYATIAELRAHFQKTVETDDWELAQLLDGAARMINRTCNRPDGFVAEPNATAKYYMGSGLPYQWIDECVSVSSVAVKDSPSDDEDDYTSWTVGTVGSTTSADVFPASGSPEQPDYRSTPYTLLVIGANGDYSTFTSGSYTHRGGFRPMSTVARGVPTVQVTARWGYASSPPDDIRIANLMQAARWHKRLQSAMADSLASTDFGTLLYRQRLDPDIEQILIHGRYVRPPIGRRA